MYKLILISLIAVLAFSCEKKISIPLPDEPTRPVLNVLMNQDSVIVARVTLSGRNGYFGGGNSSFTEPEGAVVKLYENDIYVETLHDTIPGNDYDSSKIYRSYAKVNAGKRYKVTLEIPGYEMAEGVDVIPERTDLTVRDKSMFLTPTEYGYNNNNFRFTMTNTGSTKRSYRFRMHSGPTYYIDPNTHDTVYSNYKNAISIKSQNNDLSIFSDDYADPITGGIYSIQALNPGESKIFTLVAENVEYYNSYFLEISALTDDSYNYLYTLNSALKNEDDPTAERQNVICNIRNGFGIVGGMAIQEVEFK